MNKTVIAKLATILAEYDLVWKSGDTEYKRIINIQYSEDEETEIACLEDGSYLILEDTEISLIFVLMSLNSFLLRFNP